METFKAGLFDSPSFMWITNKQNTCSKLGQPNARNSHVVADEIIWEQYILKKCPCRPVERCFSETQCSQVGVFEATWEQYVPDNRPYRPLQGRFRKTYCSQVFRPALSAFPHTTFVIVTNLKYRNHRDASEHDAEQMAASACRNSCRR